MASPVSVSQIDLTPLPGVRYFTCEREWREEFVYFLMTDRFQDSRANTPVSTSARSVGFPTENDFYGGTIQGVADNLDYIAGLGCTAIWLSPVLAANSYHGYDIHNYLTIETRFGTKEDLLALTRKAHGFTRDGKPWPMRIIMDVVINHSGDNWHYPGNVPYHYSGGERFPFGDWRAGRKPVPTELADADLYHRCGDMADYDHAPENQNGDMSGLKDYANDDTPSGSTLINLLIKCFCYWIRETDIDGFRVDAVKHMGALACSRFCSSIREYAYSLGKRGFFLFGEVATAADDVYNSYLGPNTSTSDNGETIFFGLNSVLDFRLAEGIYGDRDNAALASILKGQNGPEGLYNRWNGQRDRALNRGELGRYLVTFFDSHDSFWQPTGRFANGATDDQVIGAAGFLLCALGTPCLYYGTEQGFSGHGNDVAMREAMFEPTTGKSLLNRDCALYKAIATLAECFHTEEALRFGRMYYRPISGDGVHFGLPFGSDYTLAFSRMLYATEVLVAYNVSSSARADSVLVESTLHHPGSSMQFSMVGTEAFRCRPPRTAQHAFGSLSLRTSSASCAEDAARPPRS